MILKYDLETRRTSNADGVDINIPGWGDPSVVEYVDPSKAEHGLYFNNIANMLVDDLGYVRNVSLRGAPYDFRKGPSKIFNITIKFNDINSISKLYSSLYHSCNK